MSQKTFNALVLLSLLANTVLGYAFYHDHQRLGRVSYDFAHDVGQLDDTRLATYEREATQEEIKADDQITDPSLKKVIRCNRGWGSCVMVRGSLSGIVERQDGRIHDLEQLLSPFTPFDVTFYGDYHNVMTVQALIQEWKVEHDPDNDGSWDYGAQPDLCPDGTGATWRGVTGCPDFDRDGTADIQDDDVDGDEVKNADDTCAWTDDGAEVNASGCSVTDLADMAAVQAKVDSTLTAGVNYGREIENQPLIDGRQGTIACVLTNGEGGVLASFTCTKK